ncbi:IclR family transcriptional regulator [Pseudonocardia nigra]|uniref:IclR family transcriptional regulator n=1 Tax=Pseudonocardia nigra TaxID=1921578 RepID=UPI001C5DAF42|nr:IclR family transcriptional regulator [Pseudonocardia nigra]
MRTLETVERALRMLQLFDHPGQEMTVGAMAAALGIHRSNASRFAATLAERGFLERSTTGEAFRLGPEIGRLGMLSIADRDLVTDAQPVMQRLADKTGENVVLSVLDQGEALDIAQADGSYIVGTRKWRGRRAPLHSSSDGKVFLAFAGAAEPDDLLRAEIEQVRHQGWAASLGELEEGLHGLAVPVRDHLGRCVAALSVSGPDYRLPKERLEEVAAVVTDAAAEISARLGYAAPRDE